MLIESLLEDIDNGTTASVVKSIQVPPRPEVLAQVQAELRNAAPDFGRLADLAMRDVLSSAALLKLANSSFVGLPTTSNSIFQAIQLLGTARLETVLIEVSLRAAFSSHRAALPRFWDAASLRSRAMAWLAQELGSITAESAYTVGLFLDVGIAILLCSPVYGASYAATLQVANSSTEPFCAVERLHHGTDHAAIGATMVREWGLPKVAALVVRLHHNYESFAAPDLTRDVGHLLAMSIVADHLVHRFRYQNLTREWEKGGVAALSYLGAKESHLQQWLKGMSDVLAQP